MSVLFGSTAFDSFRELAGVDPASPTAVRWSIVRPEQRWRCVAFCVGVAVILAVGSAATGVGEGTRRRDLPALFAHSVVPIIVGYIVAHYLNYLLEVGWDTLILASDPLGTRRRTGSAPATSTGSAGSPTTRRCWPR